MACSSGTSYTIKSGDTLFNLAQQFLGDGNRWHELKDPNGNTFTDAEAHNLQVGQEVCIPSGGEPVPAQVPVPGNDVGERILGIMNGERRGFGLPPLTLDPRLNASALFHSNKMAETNVFEHQVPGEPALGERVTSQGYRWSRIEENISAGQSTPEDVVSGWFNETPPNDGHRQNILGDVQNAGVGHVFRAGTQFGHYWTVDFGKPA